MIWLRWRLLQNQWSRHGLGAFLALLVAVAGVCLGVGSFVGMFLVAVHVLGSAPPLVVDLVWFALDVAFLFFWATGLLAELQRSESVDLQRLMHLPVALGQLFVLNYVVSHLTLSVVIFVPAMLGLVLGLAWARASAPLLLLVPLALASVAMITAWTYCLRGWLAAMMNDPRRRRAIVMGITLVFVLVLQLPNLFFNVLDAGPAAAPPPADGEAAPAPAPPPEWYDDEELLAERVLLAQQVIPPLWLPAGAHALAEGRPWPALVYTAGCLAVAAAGLLRAYRSTLRAYRGEGGARSAAPPSIATTGTARFLEARLPGVPEQAAVVALATLRSYLRAPEVKMAWAVSFFVTLLIGASFLVRAETALPMAVRPFVVVGVAAWSLFMLIQFLANQFGFDRDGFRALVLSPVDRRLILLGKNLANLPIMVASGGTLVVATALWLRLPPLTLLATLLQLAALQLLVGIAGNALSIVLPFRIEGGSMKPTKMPFTAMFVIGVCQLILLPLVMTPAFVPPAAELAWQQLGGSPDVPVNLGLSALLCAAAAGLYAGSLGPLGRLLQRRETQILGAVTRAVE